MAIAAAATPSRAADNLESLIDLLIAKARGAAHLTVRDLLNAVGRRSYGPLVLMIGIFAISPITLVPGLTFFTAALAFVVAGQMAIGLRQPWLPRQALERAIPERSLVGFLEKARPWARRVDRFLKPRLTFLAAPPFANLVALFVVAAAVVTIPLGFFPLLPFLPSLAILVFGLGVTARDGLLLLIGMALFGAALLAAWSLIF